MLMVSKSTLQTVFLVLPIVNKSTYKHMRCFILHWPRVKYRGFHAFSGILYSQRSGVVASSIVNTFSAGVTSTFLSSVCPKPNTVSAWSVVDQCITTTDALEGLLGQEL